MNSDRSPFISSRLKSGLYALNKLASAGLTLLLLVILSGMLPLQDQLPLASDTDLPIPLSYWVYGYAMTASILADFVLYVLPPLSRDKQISIYAAAGFLCFYALYVHDAAGTDHIASTVAGMCTVLLFYVGKKLFVRDSLITLIFALLVPLLCWGFL
ncbi:hypothetical protein BK138_21410 [Paenibacillus rhizosphaerae]|uniref:Uncharacterized protein n=1 Tax=Paenibacillus rhizosphaerae TaxID=297318 RepID=A0A1R1ELE7_9BACL|nr:MULTISPECIES: hypothetical protein [Paenibacillus]MBJ9989995.1 hypothetical protein [Paenibacillus sp. S28]MEC0179153.1 hypothetical protein [Paenibacillus favisporus]OMF52641.1 hypothetical protein BK138_21410 [Paenibacillus rhizosphaerae]RED34729.1 hypothetical protein C7820_4393 [Paenibacillus sp. VMFN-D1]